MLNSTALSVPGSCDPVARRSRIRSIFKSVQMVSPKVGGFYYPPIFGWQFENH
ncbi:MAG TPA: hypothetical protein VHB98_00725 [Chloroflexota bacterium]|nr:hypothetical protein [Chloroflexota bacterium]